MKQKRFSRFLYIMVLLALVFGAALPAYTQVGTVTAVNDGPYTTNEGVMLTVPEANGLLSNDIDSDGDTLEVDNWSPPACGGVVIPCGTISGVNQATGAFNYTPPGGFAGTVTFTYTATDNLGGFDSALVTIIVQATGTNDAPIITPDTQQVSTPPSTPFTFTNFSVTDIDAGDQALNVAISVPAGDGVLALGSACATGDVDGSDGTLDFNGDLACINSALNSLSFTPDALLIPGDSTTMTIIVDDLGNTGSGGALDDTATVTINIAGVIISVGDGVLVEEGNPATDSYDISLASDPGSTVTIDIIIPDLPNDCSVSPNQLTFNTAAAQTVTVSAVQDGDVEGDHTCLITHSATGGGYTGIFIDDVIATVLDDDTPDLIVNAGGINLDESNSTPSTYTIRLGSNPGAGVGTVSVAIAVQNNPDLECTIPSTNPVTFTSADWFTEKDVDVMVLDDGEVEGSHTCLIRHTVTVATPPSPYQGLTEDLPVPVTDNDNVSIVIAHIGGGNTTVGEEPPGGFTDTYSVRLGSLPLGDVTVDITPDAQCTVDLPSTTFTTGNWDSPVTVTVTAAPDTDVEGNHICVISHDATSAADAAYNDLPAVNFNVNVVDDDAGANDPPVAVDDTFSTPQDTPLNIAAPGILGNDTDADLDTLTAVNPSSIIPGGAGTLTVNANGSFDYTPASGFTGSASFTYQAFDGTVNSNTATVTITVTPAATAGVTVNPTTITVTEGDSGNFTVQLNTVPTTGSVTITSTSNSAECTITSTNPVILTDTTPATVTVQSVEDVTPEPTETCTITNTLSGVTAPEYSAVTAASVTVTVNDDDTVNNPPVANNDTYNATQDTTLNVAAPGVLVNDTDADGPSALTVVGNTTPTSGSVTLNANGSFSYVPQTGFTGIATFDYTISDGTDTDSATVTITVGATPVNNPPVAVNDSYTALQDQTLNIAASGVLMNDFDADGDTLTVNTGATTTPTSGSVTLNADGSFSYVPQTGFTGIATFTYIATDGTDDSLPATVTITVNAVANNAPVAVNDSYTTPQDTPLVVAAPGVLANDTDADSDPLTVNTGATSVPTSGSVTLNADGSFTYTPTGGFSGTDSFTYIATDGADDSLSATVTITVTPAGNVAPVANNDPYNATELVPLVIAAPGVLANDTDANGDPLQAQLVTNVTNGTLTLNADGSFTYTSNAGATTDSFTYNAFDGFVTSAAPATVTITITPTGGNTAPVVTVAGVTTSVSGNLVVINVPFTDNPGDTHTATIDWGDGSGPQPAVVAGLAVDGAFTYPTTGTFTITIVITDQLGASGSHTIILDVGTGVVSYPPPVALCMDQNFIETSTIRANVPDAIRHTVRCRPIVANGVYTNSPEEAPLGSENIGNLSVLQMGVQQAVDVFSIEGLVNLDGVTVCLRGSGTLLHLYGAPRTPHTVPTYPVAAFPGFTCGSLPQTGTLVLVNGSANTSGSGGGGSSQASPLPTLSDPGLHLDSFPECTAVAFGGVTVRSTPSERGGRLGVLSPDTPMSLVTRVGMWYVIDYQGQTGYVRMDLVAFSCSG